MAITAKITDASRAIHVLEGILKGISCDNKVNDKELSSLKTWLDMHKSFSYIFPFCDIYEFIERIYADKHVSESEKIELIDFCNSFQALNGPIDMLTMEMRNLHGFVQGICSDGTVSKDELKGLEKWMIYHESNRNNWPFNEIYSAVERILKDGIVSKAEQKEFLELAQSFYSTEAIEHRKDQSMFIESWMQSSSPTVKTIDQIIAKNPSIQIPDNTFCFTGQMKSGTRRLVERMLLDKGGIPVDDVTHQTNYLVVGALSNPCWTYSTYGRKIEKVMNKCTDTEIIGELDFMEALHVQ